MNTRKHTKFVHEGNYAAEVEIGIIDSENGWAPHISLDDALKLDCVRESLKSGDVGTARKYAKKVYALSTVAA